jgi:hypothetical protein
MSLPFSNKTQDQVAAANVRAALNNGKEWGTSGSTVDSAALTTLSTTVTTGSEAEQVAAINLIRLMLKNLNA